MTQDPCTIGIDFGTYYTKVVYYDDMRNEVVPILDETHQSLFPSVLLFNENQTIFGNEARYQNLAHATLISELKRFIGRDFRDIPRKVLDNMPFKMRDNENNEIEIVIENELGEEIVFKIEELIAIQLGYIKQLILNRIPNPDFNNIILTVPSSFNWKKIEAMKKAFKIAGLNVRDVMRESTAILYEYNHHNLIPNGYVALVNIGESIDVTIARKNNEELEIVSHYGEVFDEINFDEIIMNIIIEELEDLGFEHMELFRKERIETRVQKIRRLKMLQKLRKEAENVKIMLSRDNHCEINLERILSNDYKFEEEIIISRDDFEEQIRENDLMDIIRNVINDAFRDAHMRINQINNLIIEGGATRIPCIRRLLEDIFPGQRIFNAQQIDPMMTVAKGSCRYAHNIIHDRMNNQIREIIPKSLGFESNGGRMMFIGRRGEHLPTVLHHIFATNDNNSTNCEIEFYEGESEYAMSNDYIGRITFNNLPVLDENRRRINATFTITELGQISVSATSIDADDKVVNLSVYYFGINQEIEEIEEKRRKIEQFVDFPIEITRINQGTLTQSIGIQRNDGGMIFVARRGDRPPIRFEYEIETFEDDQTSLQTDLLKGEFDEAERNDYVSTTVINGIPKEPKGMKIIVVFEVSQQGQVRTTAKARKEDGEEVELNVEGGETNIRVLFF